MSNILKELLVQYRLDNVIKNPDFADGPDSGTFDNWSYPDVGPNFYARRIETMDAQSAIEIIYTGNPPLYALPNFEQTFDAATIAAITGKKIVLSFGCYAEHEAPIYFYFEREGEEAILSKTVKRKNGWAWYSISINFPPDGYFDTFGFYPVISAGQRSSTKFTDINLSVIDTEEINLKNLTIKNNLSVEIEDDLFTFISNDDSLEFLNNYSEGYFDLMKLIDEGTRQYAFQFKYELENGETQYQILFSDRENITRVKDNIEDKITIDLFEITSLMNDQGDFIGNYIDNEDELFYGYTRFINNTPEYLSESLIPNEEDGELSILEDRLLPGLKASITRGRYPILPETLQIESLLGIEEATIKTGSFDDIIGNFDGGVKVIDMYMDKDGRQFIMCVNNDHFFNPTSNSASGTLEIFEIVNGDSLVNVYQEPLRSPFPIAGFIKIWEAETTSEGDCSLAFFELGRVQEASNIIYCELYVDGFAKNENTGLFGDPVEIYQNSIISGYLNYFLRIYVKQDGDLGFGNTSSGPAYQFSIYPEEFVSSFGLIQLTGGEVDYSVIDYLNEFSSNVFSNLVMENFAIRSHYNLNYSIFLFPIKLFISGESGFSDSTISDIMQDICKTQDAVWYFTYPGNFGVKLHIRRRSLIDSDSISYIEDVRRDTEISELRDSVTNIQFDSIDSMIYRNNPRRREMYRDYYQNKYGGGKLLKSLTMIGYKNFNLGEIKRFTSQISRSYMVKRLEWKEKDNVTEVDLFQIGEANNV